MLLSTKGKEPEPKKQADVFTQGTGPEEATGSLSLVQLPSERKRVREGGSGLPTLLKVGSLLQTMPHCKHGSFDLAEVP